MGMTATEEGEDGPANPRLLLGLLMTYGLLWIGLAIDPLDRRDWLLENLLAVGTIAILLLTYRRFKFSTLSYGLIVLFLLLHAIGAHYTYAEVPFGFWLKDTFHLSRNPFDRIVHFAFGALLAYPLRELLIRLAHVRGFWSYYLPASGILAQSGFFEVIEGIVAMLVNPELGARYLGTQGDEWDAQKDMAAAFAGALIALGIAYAILKNSPSPVDSRPAADC